MKVNIYDQYNQNIYNNIISIVYLKIIKFLLSDEAIGNAPTGHTVHVVYNNSNNQIYDADNWNI